MTTERAVHLRIEGHGAVNGEVTGRLAEGGTGWLCSVIGVEEVPARSESTRLNSSHSGESRMPSSA